MSIRVESFSGAAAAAYLDDLAQLRIEIFREWPYLYDGDLNYERSYLRTFLNARDSILVLAFDGPAVIGASTGLPLSEETPNLQRPFLENGYSIESVFYYGESVLRRSYRGQGIGVRFFEHREAWARRLDRFDWLAFCAVQRPAGHPRRPAGYVPLDRFWQKRGFSPTDLIAYISWQDLDETAESAKPLRVWVKKLIDQES